MLCVSVFVVCTHMQVMVLCTQVVIAGNTGLLTMNGRKLTQSMMPMMASRFSPKYVGRSLPTISAKVESRCSLVPVAVASTYLLHFVRTMADTSLWNDELFSVIRYSSQGPRHVVTNYPAANNHIFFNLVNAARPRIRVRLIHSALRFFWAFIAVGAMQGLVLWEFFRRRLVLRGCGAVRRVRRQPRLARPKPSSARRPVPRAGRGRVGSGSAAISRAAADRRPIRLGAATLLGTWSVPSYVIFAGPVWPAARCPS